MLRGNCSQAAATAAHPSYQVSQEIEIEIARAHDAPEEVLRRLKQPKYLFGGIVGAGYFYFYFLRHLVTGVGRGRGGLAAVSPEHLALLESLGALLLFTLVFFAWLIPHQRATLA